MDDMQDIRDIGLTGEDADELNEIIFLDMRRYDRSGGDELRIL